jgi:hypothetical protein
MSISADECTAPVAIKHPKTSRKPNPNPKRWTTPSKPRKKKERSCHVFVDVVAHWSSQNNCDITHPSGLPGLLSVPYPALHGPNKKAIKTWEEEIKMGEKEKQKKGNKKGNEELRQCRLGHVTFSRVPGRLRVIRQRLP